jgi:hypothetical protein
MTGRMSRVTLLSVAILTPFMGGTPAATSSTHATLAPPASDEFETALFFELNDTDGDLGIHGAIDGGVWSRLQIEAPGERILLNLISAGNLQRQGLTQLNFESAEPSFDELTPERFFRRFPEGRYEISGRTQSGRELQGTATLSHVLPAAPENIFLSGVAAPEDCDVRPLPTVHTPVLIEWDPVTTSHPEIGKKGRISISRYQLFVEGDTVNFSVDLPPTVTRFEVPAGVTKLGKQFKFEIIARATNNNNTAVESCFRVR